MQLLSRSSVNRTADKMSAAETLPIELLRYCLAIQLGYTLHWSAMRAMLRNGLVGRRFGTWVLTTTGLSAAGIASGLLDAGEITLDGFANQYQQPDFDGQAVTDDGFEGGFEGGFDDDRGAGLGRGRFNRHPYSDDEWAGRQYGIENGRFLPRSGRGDIGDIGRGGMSRADIGRGGMSRGGMGRGGLSRGGVDDTNHIIPGVSPIEPATDVVAGSEDAENLLMNMSVEEPRGGSKIWRWVAISASGYRDVDGELVTRAALAADVARADKDGDYGPLVWWHEYKPLWEDNQTGKHTLYEALVLGHCDFNSMAGPENEFLLESGTFVNEEIGRAMMNNMHRLAVSIKFTYDEGDIDGDLTYHRIRRRERSLLPRFKEANLFTNLLMDSSSAL